MLKKNSIQIIPAEKDVLVILIDQDVWRKINTKIFGFRPKFPPSVNSVEEFQVVFDDLEYKKTKNYALRRLSKQNYFSKNLERLLYSKLVQQQTVNRIISECKQWGFLDDDAWLNAFMRAHTQRLSIKAIAAKLRAKGVEREQIEQLIETWKEPSNEKNQIVKFLEKRARSKNLKDFKERQKCLGALLRKGYAYEMVLETFKELNF